MRTIKRQAIVVRPPQQERSRRTLDRILDATERLLPRAQFDDLSVQRIVGEAGVAMGSFYARFPSKESMLAALVQRYFDTLAASALELYARVPPQAGLEERARAIASERVQRYRQSPGLLRSLVLLERTRPKALPSNFAAQAASTGGAILDFMQPVFGKIAHRNPADAVARGFYFISAICRERVLFPGTSHAAATPLSDTQLVDELARLLVGYLTTAPDHEDSKPNQTQRRMFEIDAHVHEVEKEDR